MAPANDAGICQRSRGPWPSSSRRYPQVPEALPGTRPIAFDMVAVTGGNPNATSVGNVTRVPDPTTALIVPAPDSGQEDDHDLDRGHRPPPIPQSTPRSGCSLVVIGRELTPAPYGRPGRRQVHGRGTSTRNA